MSGSGAHPLRRLWLRRRCGGGTVHAKPQFDAWQEAAMHGDAETVAFGHRASPFGFLSHMLDDAA